MAENPEALQAPTARLQQDPRPSIRILGLGCLLVLFLWGGPALWYSRPPDGVAWPLELRPRLDGWHYEPGNISDAEGRALLADHVETGTYQRQGQVPLRWFAANRGFATVNEIGLFAHTPDRCWTQSGWTLESSLPETKMIHHQGKQWQLERRLFRLGNHLELVYFGGLIQGQPPRFRLDHNLSVAQRKQNKGLNMSTELQLRLTDGRLWGRVADAFRSRTPLSGSRTFFRVSVPVAPGAVQEGDALIESVLSEWLNSATSG